MLKLYHIIKSSYHIDLQNLDSGEVAQWLAPRICSANREVVISNLTVSTDDPLG